MTQKLRKPGKRLFFYLSFFMIGLACFFKWILPKSHHPELSVTKAGIAASLESSLHSNFFPNQVEVQNGTRKIDAIPSYTLDLLSQHRMEKLFSQYRPDYGAFVALDAETGAVLSLLSYSRDPNDLGNLSLKATFPAASIFKVVTAVAALDQKKAEPNTIVSYTGANHTLYKQNLSEKFNPRWARHVTLRDAFARSINTVFGKVGLYLLKPEQLFDYAKRFQFNTTINADVPVQPGTFYLEAENDYKMAEAASGFTRTAQMSPLQGALMAAAIVNEGVMMEPYLVSALHTPQGEIIYKVQIKPLGQVMQSDSALKMRSMMTETVIRGTSQKSFRDLLRKKKSHEIEMGGKTGHLTGLSPKGNYDWFIGYATDGKKRVAIAALTINEDTWRVKASYLARQFFEGYFKTIKTTEPKP